MIKVQAHNNLKSFSKQILKSVYKDCSSQKNQHKAYLSIHTSIDDFLKITSKNMEHIVYDFSEKPESGVERHANIALPLASMLFLDLPDKSFFRSENESLDIEHIRQMIIPLKYQHNVKEVYIDDFNKISCNLMGRNKLWQTNPGNLKQFEDWKDRQMEYKMALLFYMSRKFDINFNIGMQWTSKAPDPSHIRFMNFGHIYDMVDEIEFTEI